MKKISFFAIVILLSSCKDKGEDLEKSSIIQVPTSPIYASNEQTDVLISDYIAGEQIADSITVGKGMKSIPWSRTDSIFSFEMNDVTW